MMKTCSKCKETKDFSEFTKDKTNTYGFTSQCKECQKKHRTELKTNASLQLKKEITRSIIIENKILAKENKKLCRKCKQIFNISDLDVHATCKKCLYDIGRKRWEEKSEHIKEYVEKNKEKIKKRNKEWYEENKERLREKQKEYAKKNKEKVKETQKRCREQNIEHYKKRFNEWQKQYRLKKKLEILQQN